MAERLGVSRNTITNWEGDKTTPSLSSLRVFAEETGVDLAWLLGIDESMSRSSCITDADQLDLFPDGAMFARAA